MKIYRFKNKMSRCDCGNKVTLRNVTDSRKFPIWEVVCEKCGAVTMFGLGQDMETQIEGYKKYWGKEWKK